MGIAASQARYLYLTARQINIEFEGQQINQARTCLANEEAGLFKELTALECPTCPTEYYIQSQCQTWANNNPAGPKPSDYAGGTSDPQYLADLEIWNTYKAKIDAGGTASDAYAAAYTTAVTNYTNQKNQYDQASNEIEAKTEQIQRQDQALELQLRQLDTERQTITTELESVKKVLDKNIDQVFKTFQT